MSIEVTIALEATNEIVDGLNRLLPQLSAHAAPLSIADVQELVRSEASTLFVARDGDEVIGTLTLVIFPIPTGERAWIEDVVVDAGARGRGVGELLTKVAIEEATRRAVRTIDLSSRPSRTAANALYRKLGFVERETNVYRFFIENRKTK
ncbi:MAG TPA: GNAT family N-acetyltransferase [Acidimicrobiales bacterium]|nr:GNAT family N-acetyltransferase [Acidimicrobiales bacterium]